MRLLGAILAGGASSRFGSDKAQALFRGRPLIEWVEDALAGQTDRVIVCGGDDGLSDRPGPGLGPLGGLSAALHHAATHGFDAIVTAPCDAPTLPHDLVRQLTPCGPCVVVAEMPVVGLWPAALAMRLDAFLATGGSRAMRAWVTAANARACTLAVPLPNLNRPEDLRALERERD